MRVLSTKLHGYMDYAMAVLLIASPWLFNFDYTGAETWVPIILGAATMIYSLMTDYELGAMPMISMRTHLAIDLVAGIFLALSPWIFGFAELVWVPHLVLGILEIGAATTTKKSPMRDSYAHKPRTSKVYL